MIPPRPRTRFVLASASPARLATLRAAGLDPEVIVSGVSEDDVTATDPGEYARVLARRKAAAVAGRAELADRGADTLVLGCDSVLELDGEIHGKPGTPEAAVARWHRMRGRTGVLHTGHCLIRHSDRRQLAETASTVVRFGDPSDAEIDAYVGTGEPVAVAGAFTIDGYGGAFIDGVEGDPHNVVGVCLPMVRRLVIELGVRWTDLWRR